MAYKKTRSPNHDYHSRSIYLISINKAVNVPIFAILQSGSRASERDAVRSANSSAVGEDSARNADRSANSSAVGEVDARMTNTAIGEIIEKQILAIPKEFPETKIIRHVIMPDHIHFVIFVKRRTDYHLGSLIAHFKGNCTRAYRREQTIFEEGFHDRVLRGKNQLQAMINYVNDNPRRLMIRRHHAGYFHTPCVLFVNGTTYTVFGNFLLLRSPSKAAVRVSSKFSATELSRRRKLWWETIREAGVLVSPFISEAERRVRDYGIANGANIILITDNEISSRYKPSGELFRLCAEGRLLVISIFKPGNPLKAERTHKFSRSTALYMNDLAERIADLKTDELILRRGH
jgi:REP element-mobilizing transposase RayT